MSLFQRLFVERLSFTQKRSSGLAAGYGLIVEWSSLPTWAIGYS
ncbi:MAG: hypothetical protein VX545_00695 [SAR324 cluster bacterium]|nr:hypothetical protein [SAR324 cluster bacterium]